MKLATSMGLTLLAALALTLQGCGTMTYSYGDEKFNSPEEALAAQDRDISNDLEGVTKKSPHVGGKALVFVPSRSVIGTYGVTAPANVRQNVKMMSYLVDMTESDYLTIADVVERGGFFDSVVVGRNESDIEQEKPDYIIELVALDYDDWQWYVFRAADRDNAIALHFESDEPGAERLNSFNDSLSSALGELAGDAKQKKRKKGKVSK